MPQASLVPLLVGLVAGLLLSAAGFLLIHRARKRAGSEIMIAARNDAERMRRDAGRESAALRSQAELDARMEAVRVREGAEAEAVRRRKEVDRDLRSVEDKVRDADRRITEVRGLERKFEERETGLATRQSELDQRENTLASREGDSRRELERVAALSTEDARRELLRKVEEEARSDAAALTRDIKEQARQGAEKESKRILSMAMQRIAAEHTAESTVAAVALPNDEMKGRIIGREGRNIRAFETATGVDVIIDDTPDTVIISCFDPIRREVARRALDALITDGRIHPGRIEEVVEKLRGELDSQLVELGERAAYDAGVNGLHPEIIRLIGRMRYRSSYGQNLLEHSKEVSWLAGNMAAELKVDVALAKRGALLHDIGKVLTHDHEGTHVELGVEVARKFGESEPVINCIHAHHDDVPHESTESVLVQAADAVSGSRPGARREAFESYVKRLTRLEEIASAFDGVEKTSVIQAGREIRVVVRPESVDDATALSLSEEIAQRIEGELQYPGQIKVVVIRETRAVGFAR